MKSKRKFLSIIAILFALVFALSVCFFAACGNKDDDEKDNDTTTEQDGDTGETGGTDTEGDEDDEGKGNPATVLSVTLSAEVATLEIDETANLTASVTMSDNSSAYSGGYKWISSDTTVATVESATTTTGSNTVTAVGAGSATITVTVDNDKSGSCSITVDEAAPVITKVEDEEEFKAALEAGGNIELGDNIVGMFTVSADTTLDLAGYSITDKAVATTADTDETQYTITVDENASLTIKDSSTDESGSIVCTYAANGNENSRLGAAVYTCGTLDIVGGTIESSSVGILAEGGTTTITGGTISTEYYTIFEAHGTVVVNVGGDAVVTGTRGIYVGGDAYYGYGSSSDSNSWDDDADCTLNVYGNAEISTTFGSAISTLGYTGMNTAKINISGGTISGRPVEYEDGNTTEKVTVMPAIYLPNGILNISGGTIEGTTAIEFRGGTANISGGTIKTTAKTTNTPAWNGSGATSYGYAIAVYSYNTVNRPDTNATIDNTLNVTVSGGTIEGPLCETWKEGATVPEYTFAVTGGTFTADPSEYVASGYEVNEDETTGCFEVIETAAELEEIITLDFTSTTDFNTSSCIDTTSIIETTAGVSSRTLDEGTEDERTEYYKAVDLLYANGTSTGFSVMQSSENEAGKLTKIKTQNKVQCLEFSGTAGITKNSIVYELEAGTYSVTLTYYNGNDGRYATVLDSEGNALVEAATGSELTTSDKTIKERTVTFTIDEKQNIYFGSASNGLYVASISISNVV